jgi:hypothetical protein
MVGGYMGKEVANGNCWRVKVRMWEMDEMCVFDMDREGRDDEMNLVPLKFILVLKSKRELYLCQDLKDTSAGERVKNTIIEMMMCV